jgi:hypothetical protein
VSGAIVHVVSGWQHWRGRIADALRLDVNVPRARCGADLLGTDVADPGPDAPVCPDCKAKVRAS